MQDNNLTYNAAEQLRRVAEMTSYLSDEKVFGSKLGQITDQLCKLRICIKCQTQS